MFFRMVYKSGQIFLPFCHNSRVWWTDRILIARPRLPSMQRGKNVGWVWGTASVSNVGIYGEYATWAT